jgi:thioesterase domain-containing protein
VIAWITRGLLLLTTSLGAWLGVALARPPGGLPVELGAVLGAAMMPLAVQAIVLSASFAVSRAEASPIPAGLARGWPVTLRAYAREVWDSTMTFAWRMPFRVGWRMPAPTGHEHKPAVLLVHGFLCNRGLWASVAPALSERGYEVHALSLEPVWGSIEDYSEAMQQAIEGLLKAHANLVIIGHSMGGLVARQALRKLDAQGRARVARIITLGTPHLGTVHAQFGFGKNAAQMRRESPWLRDLFAEELARGGLGVPSTVVLSYHDNIVAPQALAWPHPEAQQEIIELAGVGHLSLALDPQVWDLIYERLAATSLRSGSLA